MVILYTHVERVNASHMQDFAKEGKDFTSRLLTYLVDYGAVCRLAPATLGLTVNNASFQEFEGYLHKQIFLFSAVKLRGSDTVYS